MGKRKPTARNPAARKSSGPTEPRTQTVKRLFGLSSNRCAFPECQNAMIDPKYGSVLGQICHIKGEKPEAPRHDKKQTNAERHGFGNLILMCGPHHKIIDDHWKEFTVAKDGESCRRMTVRFGGMTLAAEAWYRDDPSVTRLPLGKPVYNARIPVPAGTASLRRVE